MKDSLNVNEWIRFADTDLGIANHLAETYRPNPFEIVCYHCQQCVEKILKAYLIAKQIDYKKVHDLNLLLNDCAKCDGEFDRFAEVCISLTSYAVITRYPVGEDDISEYDMKKALSDALKILTFTKSKLAE
jgi:HEPN domain-containing protein